MSYINNLGNLKVSLLNFKNKNYVIDYLYDVLNLSNYRYNILNNVSKLVFLKENEHYVSPNFKGYNYLLVFMNINNVNICTAIDRKKLSYHKNLLNIKMLQFYELNVDCNIDLYNGTIFDCKLIQKNMDHIFLIQDYFYLSGENMINLDINTKLSNIDKIIPTIKSNNFIFKINKLFTYYELDTLIDSLPSLTYDNLGLIFFPKKSGINILYIDKKNNKNDKIDIHNNSNEIIEQKSYNLINNYVEFLKSRNYSYENENNNKTKKLLLTKTNIPDVYNLYDIDTNDKLGIASIPNLKISYMCDKLIQNDPVIFNCVYCNRFNKWIPIKPV